MIDLEPDDHILGPEMAEVTLIAYCDFECPFCGQAYYRMKDLRERVSNRLRFVFRHFPLTHKHPLALQAAEAAETAASQDRFWPMHDLLFQYQEELEAEDLYHYADMVGLDVRRFKEDLHARSFVSRVIRDVKSGRRYGVSGTPTFFLNNALFKDDERLEQAILRVA